MSRTVTCASGLKGWQGKLRKQYSSFEEFKEYAETYNIHGRLGFETPEAAWEANPEVQGSTNPDDLRVVGEKTAVVFRKMQGEIIALFAEEPADAEGKLCSSYLHVGQHGAADYHHVIRNSKPAKPDEYADLQKELEGLGYSLEIRKRYYLDGRQGQRNPDRIRRAKAQAAK